MRAVVFLQPGWADWEAGPALAGLRAHLGAQVAVATPSGDSVASVGGVQAMADLAFGETSLSDDLVLVLAGSEEWDGFNDTGFEALLREAAGRGLPVAGICAGTVPMARAGLFAGRVHTSNSAGFLNGSAPGYAGRDLYRQSACAVSDRGVVSAPGSAPNTFAAELFRLAVPQGPAVAEQYLAMARAEWG